MTDPADIAGDEAALKALFDRAVAYQRALEHEKAALLYSRLGAAYPNNRAIINNLRYALHQILLLTLTHLQRGEVLEATRLARFVVTHDADVGDAWWILGVAATACGDHAMAARAHRRTVACLPDQARGYRQLASALTTVNVFIDAMTAALRSVILDAGETAAVHRLALALVERGRLVDARRLLRLGLSIGPANPNQWHYLGVTLKELGRADEALACFERAITREPSFVEARWNKAKIQLLLGRSREGWAGLAWRHQIAGWASPFSDHPRWDGRLEPELTVLVHGELGQATRFCVHVMSPRWPEGCGWCWPCNRLCFGWRDVCQESWIAWRWGKPRHPLMSVCRCWIYPIFASTSPITTIWLLI